ncbi:hypothetical protein Acsp06_07400 [Actinomycetospora sp. NBRC 106375]|uniref:hypothetical protein n=1 Tax=Actinomycetospora sp. NBRC 106375 TaxID=3032207 RepID=UPI0024A40FF1|nr:hypothetical protein [Actinomycetospora sp. NBRC 106375]GLZ44555.1 hypothetical protein Acsp06_07400 [Actinomycetospora sp. NBRC 106375]
MDERSPEQPYTIHEDVDTVGTVDTAGGSGEDETAPARRPGPDPLGLVAGLAAIVVAVLALTSTLAAVDPRWVLALGAVGVGLVVVVATVRRRRD